MSRHDVQYFGDGNPRFWNFTAVEVMQGAGKDSRALF